MQHQCHTKCVDIYNFIEIASHIESHGSTSKNPLFEDASDGESTYSNEQHDSARDDPAEDEGAQVVIMPDVQFNESTAAAEHTSSVQRWGKVFVNIRVHLKPAAIAVSPILLHNNRIVSLVTQI